MVGVGTWMAWPWVASRSVPATSLCVTDRTPEAELTDDRAIHVHNRVHRVYTVFV